MQQTWTLEEKVTKLKFVRLALRGIYSLIGMYILLFKSYPTLHNSWTAAHLSLTISLNLPNFTSIESVMHSNHLALCASFAFHLQPFPASGSLPMS